MISSGRCLPFSLSLIAACSAPLMPATSQGQLITRNDGAAQIRAVAERDGAVRVIVTLALAGAPPYPAQAIGAAQERLVAALAGTGYDGLHRYANLPQLSLTARRDALEVLLASPLVVSVAPDALAGTMTPGMAR
jgi:hypothetical protein